MTLLNRIVILAAFALAAAWQVVMGGMPPAGATPTLAQVRVPPAPPGWKLVRQEPVAMWADKTPGRSAEYQAPDGSRLTLHRFVGWPDRREHLPGFLPHECWYSGQGWDFDIRSGMQKHGERDLRLIQVHRRTPQGTERFVELSAYACSDRMCATWQEYKAVLIWQRVLRQRRMWVYSYVTAAPETEALAAAPELLLAALKLDQQEETTRVATRPKVAPNPEL